MSSLILDCSTALSFFIPDEKSNQSIEILKLVEEKGAIVPSLWFIEVGNALLMIERRKRILQDERLEILYELNKLPIVTDNLTSYYVWRETMSLANKYSLTLYDACYLELAIRMSLPLATFDKELKKAALKERVALVC